MEGAEAKTDNRSDRNNKNAKGSSQAEHGSAVRHGLYREGCEDPELAACASAD